MPVAAADSTRQIGSDFAGAVVAKPRRVLSAADLELEFGREIGELELGQGCFPARSAGAVDQVAGWTRLFKFFH